MQMTDISLWDDTTVEIAFTMATGHGNTVTVSKTNSWTTLKTCA